MAVSVATVLGYTLAVGGLALGIGTLYPQYDTENAAQIPTSFGGLVFMLLAIALLGAIIVLEALPVTDHLRAQRAGLPGGIGPEGIAAFAGVAALMLAAGIIPVRLAAKRLATLEV
jgi:ABC-2 type transport system permease protein